MKTYSSRDALAEAIATAAQGMQTRWDAGEGIDGLTDEEWTRILTELQILMDAGDQGAELEWRQYINADPKWIEPRSLYGLAERMQIPNAHSLVYKNSNIRGEMKVAIDEYLQVGRDGNGQWWASIDEFTQEGPFDTREDAQEALRASASHSMDHPEGPTERAYVRNMKPGDFILDIGTVTDIERLGYGDWRLTMDTGEVREEDGGQMFHIVPESQRYNPLNYLSSRQATERLSPHDLVGRGLTGFPNSEITRVQPGADDWAGGGVTWYLTVQTEDGRELKIPKTITNFGDPTHGTYEKKAKKANEMMGYPEDDMGGGMGEETMEDDEFLMDEGIPASTAMDVESNLLPAQNRVSDWRGLDLKQGFTGMPVSGYTNWDTFEVAMYVENHYDVYQATESAGGPNALAQIAEPMIRAKPEYKDLEHAGGYIEWSNVDWEDVYEGRFTT